MSAPRIAFYAPMKAPDHPTPSGDRTVARLYCAALAEAGFAPQIISDLRTFDGKGDSVSQDALRRAAEAETARLAALWNSAPGQRPTLWFTYHLHYKAPDLIGPLLCRQFQIPYVVAEASHAPKRATGPWARFHAAAEAAITMADLALVTTERDWPCVAALRGDGPTRRLPPFVEPLPGFTPRRPENEPCHLVTVAMMRDGDKLASYRLLADALRHVNGDWRLTIIGDGPARDEVEQMFAPFGARVTFAGLIEDRADLGAALSKAHLMLWPAVNEAYGMALLEAQSLGLPVVAGREGGVADVVINGQTGLLTAPRDAAALASAVEALMNDFARRAAFSVAARDFVLKHRSLAMAGRTLRSVLKPWVVQCAS